MPNENERNQVVPENEDNGNKPEVTITEKDKFFKKLGKAIAKPFKYVGRKLKESPAAATFGAIGGASLALGGKVLLEHYLGKKAEETGDTIEIPDDGEEYTTDENMNEE